MTKKTELTGLDLLRAPFPAHQISKLPKETKVQAEARKTDRNVAINCQVCGGWHHKHAVHLDYVGHAALTDRLLDADPNWSWEPVAFRDGLPAFDATGGLWIRLTVCGVTRLGYGHAALKQHMDPGSREKEVIGDALRNAAMRFGAALDLWHKGDLHADESDDDATRSQHPGLPSDRAARADMQPKSAQPISYDEALLALDCVGTHDDLAKLQERIEASWKDYTNPQRTDLRQKKQEIVEALNKSEVA